MCEQETPSGEAFDLKEARHQIKTSLEALLACNLSSSPATVPQAKQESDAGLQARVAELSRYFNSQEPLFDDTGKLVLKR